MYDGCTTRQTALPFGILPERNVTDPGRMHEIHDGQLVNARISELPFPPFKVNGIMRGSLGIGHNLARVFLRHFKPGEVLLLFRRPISRCFCGQ